VFAVIEPGSVGEASRPRISFVDGSGDSLGDATPDRSLESDGSFIETSRVVRGSESGVLEDNPDVRMGVQFDEQFGVVHVEERPGWLNQVTERDSLAGKPIS
jgi:hypothetical protein